MADDVEMIPVSAEEPPKADPLAKPAMATPKTIKLSPVPRPVTAGGVVKPSATASALRPGLKLPPKPGATLSMLKPGLKLPPKPGATVSALKPGLKLPPKPGATLSMLKPGLKLPPKPVAAPAPVAELKPVEPPKPVVPSAPVAAKPGLKLPPKPGATVSGLKPGLKLPPKPGATGLGRPVIRKPGATVGLGKPLPKPVVPGALPKPVTQEAAKPVTAEAAKPMDALKSVTQKLKEGTQQIPQQAVLHKTGIIAETALTDAQKEAAKHATSRISLSDAMGVAPVQSENAPMKTIRIKRPVDIPGTTKQMQPVAAPAASAPEPASEATTIVKAKPGVTVTQRKTLKIARPGGAVRPTGKFGVKKPGAPAKPAESAAKPAEGEVTDLPEVADIPEMPAASSAASVPTPVSAPVDTTPGWVVTLSFIVQLAACGAIGALAWFLYENTQTNYF